MRWISAVGIALVVAACSGGSGTTSGGSTSSGSSGTGVPLRPSDYAADCSAASDCVAVYFGDNACCGGCATGVIARKDKARYDADNQRFRASCASTAPCPDFGCADIAPACQTGRCAIDR